MSRMAEEPSAPTTAADQAGGRASLESRTLALLAHLLPIFTWFLPPLVIYRSKKGEDEFVADQAKESLNFQITVGIGYAIGVLLKLVFIGKLVVWGVYIFNVWFCVLAAVRSYGGERYRYPWNLRFVR